MVEFHPEFSSSQSSEISLYLDKVSIYDYWCADNNDDWTDILFSDEYYGDICSGYWRVEYYVPIPKLQESNTMLALLKNPRLSSGVLFHL